MLCLKTTSKEVIIKAKETTIFILIILLVKA